MNKSAKYFTNSEVSGKFVMNHQKRHSSNHKKAIPEKKIGKIEFNSFLHKSILMFRGAKLLKKPIRSFN